MLDDREKDEIRRAINSAFDRQSQRYYEKFFASLKSGSAKAREVAYKATYDEQSFLSRRVLFPGLFRYIAKHMLSDSVLQRHRPVLLRTCLTSLLRPEGILTDEIASIHRTGKETGRKNNGSDQTSYTRRHVQRLFHEHYPETFFKTGDKIPSKVEDARLSPYSSVFTSTEIPKTSTTNLAQDYMIFDAQKATSDIDNMRRIRLNADLKYVFPEYLEDLRQFKIACNTTLPALGQIDDRSDFLKSELASLTPTLIVFHAHFTSILSLEWFRTRRDMVKRDLLKNAYRLQYSPSDSERARLVLLEITQSDEFTKFVLESGSMAFLSYGLYDYALRLLRQCLKLKLPPISLGTSYENMAMVFRDIEQYKLMIRLMKTALGYLRDAGDVYRVSLALKNLGEAEWRMGFEEKARKCFEEAENLGNKIPEPTRRFGVYWNLATASQRLGRKDLELQYLKKCLANFPDEYGDKIMELEKRLDGLMR